jgi:hypothetical protein
MEDVDSGDASMQSGLSRFMSWDAVLVPSVRNFLFALACGLLLAAASAGLVLGQSAQYYSQATVLIDNPLAIATAHDDAPILKLNALRLKYASLANTPAILVPAAQAAGLPVAEIDRAATFPSGAALVLLVAAKTGSPRLSTQVAEAVANQIVLYVQHEHEQYNIPAQDRFVFTVVGHAYNGRKVSPSRSRAATTALGVGLGGLAIAYLILQLVTGPRRLQ